MPIYQRPAGKPQKLLALAQQLFAPFTVTWRAVKPLNQRPRVVGELPQSAGLIELLSDAAQSQVVKATLTGALAGDYARTAVYFLAVLVPELNAQTADTWLAAAMEDLKKIDGTKVGVGRAVGKADITLTWLRPSSFLTIDVTYH